MHRRMQIAVQFEDVQLLVVLKFLRAVLGNLNDHTKDLGASISERKFQIINHHVLLLL
jgi:hypothetical protein